jgi:hypothetical protein
MNGRLGALGIVTSVNAPRVCRRRSECIRNRLDLAMTFGPDLASISLPLRQTADNHD